MNENWQVSRENQSDRIGFQYGNAGEMITWKWLRRVSDFSIFWDNELVCPVGLANRRSLRRETQLEKKNGRLQFQFRWYLLVELLKVLETCFFSIRILLPPEHEHTHFLRDCCVFISSLFFSLVLKLDWTLLSDFICPDETKQSYAVLPLII